MFLSILATGAVVAIDIIDYAFVNIIRYSLFAMSVFLFLFVRTPKYINIISVVLLAPATIAMLYVPFQHPYGAYAPIFNYYNTTLLITGTLLGIKAGTAVYLLFMFFLLGFATEMLPFYGFQPQPGIDYRADMAFFTRILSMSSLYFTMIILFKISDTISHELARQKENSLKLDKVDTLSRVAAGFAHEINNPLAIISGFITNLGDRHPELYGSEAKFFDTIDRSIDRISDTVHTFLSIFSNEKRPMNTYNIRLVIEETLKREQLLDVFKISVPNRLKQTIRRDDLCHVIAIISRNAFEATKREGNKKESHLEWLVKNKHTISCVDNGSGFEDISFELAKQPFVSSQTIPRNKGLGLFKAQSLMEKMQGDIQYRRVDNFTYIDIVFKK